jgi:indolepyruvate decarboxylase
VHETLASFLHHRLEQLEQDVVFGIPGDYALGLFDALTRHGTSFVTLTHEPSLGYAADAYARIKGFGTAVVTYGAGALNMLNAVAQAYAERVPLLVISAAPGREARQRDLLVHHRVKRMTSQVRIFEEATCATAVIDDPTTAARDIDRVISTMLKESRPGYVEIPRDMVEVPLEALSVPAHRPREFVSPATTAEAERIVEQLQWAESPVVLAGIEVMRYGLRPALVRFVERWNIPVLNTMLAMTTLPDGHQNCLGTFVGACGEVATVQAVREADLVICLGVADTDVNSGLYSLDPRDASEQVVWLRAGEGDDDLRAVLATLANMPARRRFEARKVPGASESDTVFAMEDALRTVDDVLGGEDVTLTVDVGDVMFAATRLRADTILAPSYYASMGYAVPAAIGASFAAPDRRIVALVGDGAFQMTGTEIGTAVRYGLDPVVVVLDNDGFETLRAFDGDREYFQTSRWDYAAFARAIGAKSTKVSNASGLRDALSKSLRYPGPTLIEATLEVAPSRALCAIRDVAKGQGNT